MNKKPRKQKRFFYCFACKRSHSVAQLAKRGKRKNGSNWALCQECSNAYRAERELDTQALRAAEDDIRTGGHGFTEMGWNGVPSETSLRRRHG